MMTNPEGALQTALIALLRADETIRSLLGHPARVWDQPPESPTWPHLLIGRSESRPVEAEGGATEHVLTLTCRSRFGGAEEAKAVTAAVRACVDDAWPAMAGGRVVSLRATYVDVFRGADWRSVLGVVRVRAVTEPI